MHGRRAVRAACVSLAVPAYALALSSAGACAGCSDGTTPDCSDAQCGVVSVVDTTGSDAGSEAAAAPKDSGADGPRISSAPDASDASESPATDGAANADGGAPDAAGDDTDVHRQIPLPAADG